MAIVVIWLVFTLLTILFRNKKVFRVANKYDLTLLIPIWKMFSTKIESSICNEDYYIQYRDRLQDSTTTKWFYLEKIPKLWYRGLWNPWFVRNNVILNYSCVVWYTVHEFNQISSYGVLYPKLLKVISQYPKLSNESVARQICFVKEDLRTKSKQRIVTPFNAL